MSSATLTDADRRSGKAHAASSNADTGEAARTGAPGMLFLLGALVVACVAVVLLRGTPAPGLVLVALTILAAGLTGAAVYRTLAPLASAEADEDRAPLLAGRTRAALERDKALTLRAIKELEFDRAMGKVAEADFVEMHERLRRRAIRLMRQLEGAGVYRRLIERDVEEHLAKLPETAGGACGSCGAANDADARFCKMCGSPLTEGGAA